MLLLAVPVCAYADGRGVYYRPALTFVTSNAPDDMIVRMDLKRDGETVPVYLYREDRLWESYFRFYRQMEHGFIWYGNRVDFQDAVVVVMTGGMEFPIPLAEEDLLKLTMNDYFMLDLSDSSLHFGLSTGRAVLLFCMRLAITLGASLIVLYLMHYRWKKSWITVILINLVFQGALSFMLVNLVNFNPRMIGVQFGALLITLILQIPLFWWLLDENGSSDSVRYAFWSNLATGLINSYMLIHFPL
jgi:hypothetical protein